MLRLESVRFLLADEIDFLDAAQAQQEHASSGAGTGAQCVCTAWQAASIEMLESNARLLQAQLAARRSAPGERTEWERATIDLLAAQSSVASLDAARAASRCSSSCARRAAANGACE